MSRTRAGVTRSLTGRPIARPNRRRVRASTSSIVAMARATRGTVASLSRRCPIAAWTIWACLLLEGAGDRSGQELALHEEEEEPDRNHCHDRRGRPESVVHVLECTHL